MGIDNLIYAVCWIGERQCQHYLTPTLQTKLIWRAGHLGPARQINLLCKVGVR
jgi:hypothetical protein